MTWKLEGGLRRLRMLPHLSDATQARADLEQLIALQPDNAAANKLLASLLVG